jgi:hypothetical protein
LVEEDVKKFLGSQWIAKAGVTNRLISNKAAELHNMLGKAIQSNKLNFNAAAIKEFKKTELKKWKNGVERNVIRSLYAKLPYELNVIKATQNFATTKNATGKFPKKTNVLKYANARSRVASKNLPPPRKLGKFQEEI